jgi:hypothetical protein
MAQSDTNCSPRQISLIIRENTGKILDFDLDRPNLVPKKPQDGLNFFAKFPTQQSREI